MLPCKVFLEAVRLPDHRQPAVRTQLTLNGLYYDDIKQFHTRYLCLTAKDSLSVEVVRQDSGALLGTVHLPEVYKLVLERKTVEMQLKGKECEAVLVMSMEPVSALQKGGSPVRARTGSPIRPPQEAAAKEGSQSGSPLFGGS